MRILLMLITAILVSSTAFGEMTLNEKGVFDFQIDSSRKAAESISKIFQEFSDGDIEAESALTRVSVLRNIYLNSVQPVPPEVEKLNGLMKKMFSQIENYFIYFKRTNRENPEINLEIAETRYEIAKEVVRIDYLDDEEYSPY